MKVNLFNKLTSCYNLNYEGFYSSGCSINFLFAIPENN